MEWTDQALVLSARAQGESSALVSLLTEARGRHAGLVRGARTAGRRASVEPGTLVCARWRARLPEQLGSLTLEPLRSFGAALLDQPERLAALVSACALVEAGLSEREPHPALYRGLLALFEALEAPAWAEATVRWELGLLAELGFGLDLSRCAVTGAAGDLAAVSPRSGRAVSRAAAAPWGDRLLPLPAFLTGQGGGGPEQVRQGLALTGHFLERHLPGGLPPARRRLAERAGRTPPNLVGKANSP
ncbi:MAG: DNA repair protein RecO [Rhodospirillaceae bacterium]